MKKLIVLVVVLGAAMFASPSLATLIYSTGFESPTFTTGTVAGQDGWTITAGAGDIFTGTGVIAGAQSLKVYYSGANADVRKSFASQTTAATLAFKTTALITNRTSQFDLLNAATTRTAARVLFNGTGYITAYNGTTATNLMTYAAQTYDIRILADITAQTYDVYVDNVLKADDYAFYDGSATDIGTLRIMRYTSTAVNVDNVAIYSGLIPEPATVSILGLGIAGILALKRRRNES
ncbi:MAG: PEP-CTERM sorting domain-containing protein [Phycisphaerae bacterium]|nr:PEP-CTERM sorting domain-containing protein [Phycisphaerae bacterium]